MIKHVIFDFFGTISDTGTSSVDATAKILNNVGFSMDPSEFYKEWKAIKRVRMDEEPFLSEKDLYAVLLGEMFQKYGIDKDAGLEVRPYIDMLFGDRKIFTDAKQCIDDLRSMGLDVVIGSTTDNDVLKHHLQMYGLGGLRCFTSEDFKVYKPNPHFYEGILRETGWKPSECLFIGDSLGDDISGPKKAGMKAVLLSRKGKALELPEGAEGPDSIITSLAELPGYIQKENMR
ncbi:MAG: HAD family hydrolase [Firmicutes bacterium]|nr:HAD family hydrolase [Bacillota bacterium]